MDRSLMNIVRTEFSHFSVAGDGWADMNDSTNGLRLHDFQ
jgi:hypothetical protein